MLNKHNLNVAQFASKEESRYSLQGILVTPEATVATNGDYLVWVSKDSVSSGNFPVVPGFGQAEDKFEPFLLDAKTALQVAKVTPTKANNPALNHVGVREQKLEDGENRSARVLAVTDLERPQVFPVKPMAGKFPLYENVVPKWEDATFRIALDANYLTMLAKAFAGFVERSGTSKPIVLSFYSGDKPVRMDGTNNGQGMTAMLMPVPGADDQAGTYGWTEREAQREAEREKEYAKAKEEANADASEPQEETSEGVAAVEEVGQASE